MNVKFTRREMIETLGVASASSASQEPLPACRKRSSVRRVEITQGRSCRQKAKHVIMIYLNGGPSQLDMFDPKPALFKYAGQRPSAVDLRTERTTGGLAAVAVRVQALRTQRRRGERAVAPARERDRRRLRYSIDVHLQPDAHTGTRPVPHG